MQKFIQNFPSKKFLHRNRTAEFISQHTRRGILTCCWFWHEAYFFTFSTTKNQQTFQLFWLAHLILLATKTLFSATTKLVSGTPYTTTYTRKNRTTRYSPPAKKISQTFSEQIPTKCKPIHLLSSWFDKLSVSVRVTKPKKHPIKNGYNVSSNSQSKQIKKTT